MSGHLLLADLGNTDLVLVDWREGRPFGHRRVPTDSIDPGSPDSLAAEIRRVVGESEIDGAALVSVVPERTDAVARAIGAVLGCEVVVADHRSRLPIRLRYDDPSTLGPDRIVNAVAAWRLCPSGAIVVDAGTATTFEVVDGDGNFVGGIIAPGPDLAARALAEHTARLPLVVPRRPEKIVGSNTESAIEAGVYHGTAALVQGLVSGIRAELGEDLPLIVTGGWAPGLLDTSELGGRHEPWLTFVGLAVLWETNRGRRAARREPV